jgi:hypothetical protein
MLVCRATLKHRSHRNAVLLKQSNIGRLTLEVLIGTGEYDAIKLLQLLPRLLRAPSKFEQYWRPEREQLLRYQQEYSAGMSGRERERERERAYAMTYCVWLIGRIVIKDKPALDLTVVLVKAGVLQTGVGDVRSRAFRFVVHSRTRCFITLVSVELLSDTTSSNDQDATHGEHEHEHEQQQEEATRRWYHYVEYRYESWVEYQSATPHCRRNLAPLAIQLSKLEHEAGNKAVVWQFQAQPSFDSFMTTRSNKPSAIEPQQLRKHVKEFLLCASDATTTSKQV